MVVSEAVQYVTVLGLSIVFSVLALVIQENTYRLTLKIIASLCWFIFALTQFMFIGGSAVMAVPLAMLFLGFGFVFAASIVTDFQSQKREKIFGFED